jgi:hypothetical protein
MIVAEDAAEARARIDSLAARSNGVSIVTVEPAGTLALKKVLLSACEPPEATEAIWTVTAEAVTLQMKILLTMAYLEAGTVYRVVVDVPGCAR